MHSFFQLELYFREKEKLVNQAAYLSKTKFNAEMLIFLNIQRKHDFSELLQASIMHNMFDSSLLEP